MPVVTFVGSEMDNEAKADLINELTQAVCKITKTPSQFVTVIIDENKDTNIGLGGETLSEFKARLKADKTK